MYEEYEETIDGNEGFGEQTESSEDVGAVQLGCRESAKATLLKKSLAEDPDQAPLSTMLQEEFAAPARQRKIY